MTNFCFKINQVRVNTALGSAAPPLTVKLVRAFHTGDKDSAIIEGKVSDESMIYFEEWGLRIPHPTPHSAVIWFVGFCYFPLFEYTSHVA